VRTRAARIWLAGDWLDTALPSSMESAARAGYLAAEGILAQAGAPRSLAIPKRPPAGIARMVRALAARR
jgi:uncharacterized protein with NAD-binding domain and iron-sulfur cluster